MIQDRDPGDERSADVTQVANIANETIGPAGASEQPWPGDEESATDSRGRCGDSFDQLVKRVENLQLLFHVLDGRVQRLDERLDLLEIRPPRVEKTGMLASTTSASEHVDVARGHSPGAEGPTPVAPMGQADAHQLVQHGAGPPQPGGPDWRGEP